MQCSPSAAFVYYELRGRKCSVHGGRRRITSVACSSATPIRLPFSSHGSISSILWVWELL
jgi:hypothetical protein